MELGFLSVLIEEIFGVLLVSLKLCDPKENHKESFYFSLLLLCSVSYWMICRTLWIGNL